MGGSNFDTGFVVAIVMMAACLIGAAASVAGHFRRKAKAQAAGTWPIATATIMKSDIAEWVSSKGERRADADIAFVYSVDGREYEGSRLSFGDPQLTRAAANSKTRRYPVGSRHQARYDPADPREVVLELVPWYRPALPGRRLGGCGGAKPLSGDALMPLVLGR